MRRPEYRLVIDPIACDGAGVCAELFPEMITLDPWGFPIIDGGGIPVTLLNHAQRAAASCPRQALLMARTENGDKGSTAAHSVRSEKGDPTADTKRGPG